MKNNEEIFIEKLSLKCGAYAIYFSPQHILFFLQNELEDLYFKIGVILDKREEPKGDNK